MSKFLDLMDRISDGAPAPLGFGAARAEKLPGMVLVGLVSKNHAKGVGLVSELALNAAFLSGVDKPDNLKKFGETLSSIPWGAYVSALSEEQAEAFQENGGDVVTFALEGTPATAVTVEDLGRFLVLDPGDGGKRLIKILRGLCDSVAIKGAPGVDVLFLKLPCRQIGRFAV